MTHGFFIDDEHKTPKYLQVAAAIKEAIRRGQLKKGQRLSSINELSDEYLLSRDTIEKAYTVLRKEGIIMSVKGKGFYIRQAEVNDQIRVLLLFNKLSNYKKQIYTSFLQTLGDAALVDLKIHHFNTQVFKSLIEEHTADYHYIVIMPHFYEDEGEIIRILRSIPPEKLLVLDKAIPQLDTNYAAVYQDFETDIVNALEEGLDLLKKYKKLYLVYPKLIPYPPEIKKGFLQFCMNYNFPFAIINEVDQNTAVEAGEAYVVIEETDLVNLIKIARIKKLNVGEALGIISYNETPLKEILLDGITVVSTDHLQMGETAAKLILEHRTEKVKNPFSLIRRRSL